MDEVCEVSDALMERYLEGEQISHQEIVDALKEGTNHGKIFPVVCGVATRNLGTTRLLDAIVEDLPSPVKHGSLQVGEVELAARPRTASCSPTCSRRAPTRSPGASTCCASTRATLRADSQALNTRAHVKERIGQLLVFAGKDAEHVQEFGPGDIGAVAKLKETRAGDWLADRDEPIEMPRLKLPAPVMAFAVEPKSRGDEDKVLSSLRRLQEEDPTIDLHRDQQTGEQIVAGLSQVHVEVIVDRLRERFGVEVELKPPRVPYQETIRATAAAHGRHKKQSGGRGQFGDCHIEIDAARRRRRFRRLRVRRQHQGRRHPQLVHPRRREGRARGDGEPACSPATPSRACACACSTAPTTPSTPRRSRSSSPALQAMKQALELADPVLLEPIMLVTLSVPEAHVGDVIGDLNSRRGHPLGMEPVGAMTEIKAEVPMAEMLTYAPDLRSITQGQGDYTLEFLRYEELPAHLAQKVVEQAGNERPAVHA